MVARQDLVALPAVPEFVLWYPPVCETQDQAVGLREEPVIPLVGEAGPARWAEQRCRYDGRCEGFAGQREADAVDGMKVVGDAVDDFGRKAGYIGGLRGGGWSGGFVLVDFDGGMLLLFMGG